VHRLHHFHFNDSFYASGSQSLERSIARPRRDEAPDENNWARQPLLTKLSKLRFVHGKRQVIEQLITAGVGKMHCGASITSGTAGTGKNACVIPRRFAKPNGFRPLRNRA
jgi:hypothetical protein